MTKKKTDEEILQELDPKPDYKAIPPATTPQQRDPDEVIRELGTKMGEPYDEDAILQQLDPKPDETRHYKDWEVLPEMMNNLVPSAARLVGNMANAVAPWNLPQTAESTLDIIGGIPALLMPEEMRNALIKGNPLGEKQYAAAKAVLQDYIDHYGGHQAIADTLATDPMRPVTDAATLAAPVTGALRAAIPARIPQAAVDAAAILVNPTRAVEGPGRFVGNAFRAGAERMNPKARFLGEVADGNESDIIQSLRHNVRNPIVPGTRHDAGVTVVDDVTVPTWQRFVADARDRASNVSVPMQDANNHARLVDIDRVGRTHTLTDDQITRGGGVDPAVASISDLEAARDAANTVNYGPIDPRMVQADPALIDILNRPSGDVVMKIARDIAAEEGRPFSMNPYTPATSTASTVLDPFGRPVMTHTPAQFERYRGEDLIRIKKAFDRLASSRELRAHYAIDDEAARKIAATRGEFVRWMEDPMVDPATGAPMRLPEHAQAVADHQAWSRLIDRRRAGNVFADVLTGALNGEDELAQRATAFSNLFDSPRNAVTGNGHTGKATTFDYDNWTDFLTDEDLRILARNKEDLSNVSRADKEARAAKADNAKLAKPAETPQAPSLLNAPVTLVNFLLKSLSGHVNEKTANALAKAAMDPEVMADLLEDSVASRAKLDKLSKPAQIYGRGVQMMNRVPAGYNALNADRQDKEHRKRNALVE